MTTRIKAIMFFINFLFGTVYIGTVVCFTLLAFAFGMLFLCSLKSIANYFDKRRTFAMQIGACGTSVGQFVMAPAATIIISTFTVNGAYLILAGIYLNLIVPAFLFRPVDSGPTKAKPIEFDKAIFKMPTFYIYLCSQLFLNAG